MKGGDPPSEVEQEGRSPPHYDQNKKQRRSMSTGIHLRGGGALKKKKPAGGRMRGTVLQNLAKKRREEAFKWGKDTSRGGWDKMGDANREQKNKQQFIRLEEKVWSHK